MKGRRRVSFDPFRNETIPSNKFYTERDQLRSFWYTREELMESCVEAKQIVKYIHSVDGKLEAIDHSRVCIVGLEKFLGKKEKDKCRKLLIRSVLIRQAMNRELGLGHDAGCLAQISNVISNSFNEFALWQAAMHEFHAHGGPSRKLKRNTLDSENSESDQGSPKKQRLEAVVCNVEEDDSEETSTLSTEPGKLLDEVNTLMTGIC